MAHDPSHERADEARQAHERLVLPLVIPAVIFLFAVLVIYGLSRIYLELNEWHYKEVRMATPLAIGIALLILLVSAYLASRPSLPRWQMGLIALVAIGGLTGGSIWAAVHEEEEAHAVLPTATVAPGETPTSPGGIQVSLTDDPFAVTADPASAPAGSLTFSVSNDGAIIHNLRVIKTELEPDALPLDDSGFQVDEEQVEVAASLAEIESGASDELTADLEAGSYVLICNVATHYETGMYTAFTAE